MIRPIAIVAVLLLAGCEIPTPAPSPSVSGDSRYAAAAWSWSLATHGGRTPSPTPSPLGDQCENCHGTGRLGDGTVSVTCPVCNGTGKRINQPAVEPDEPGDDQSATEPTDVPATPQEIPVEQPVQTQYHDVVPMRRGLFGRWRY